MTASVLINGVLFRAPELKTSKSGNCYLRAVMKVRSATDSNGADFWALMVFDKDAIAEMAELRAGDHLAVTGALKVDIYQDRIARTVFVDRVLPLRKRKKPKEMVKPAPLNVSIIPDPDLNDPIPDFGGRHAA